MKKQLSLLAASITFAYLPLSAAADSVGTNFDVTLTLLGSCTVADPDDLAFGTKTEADIIAGDIDGSTDIEVTCSTGTDYEISLSDDNSSRSMTSGGGSSVDYELFQDAAETTAWDTTTTVSATGAGTSATHTVYGNIPAQTPTIGEALDGDTGISLTDNITVTVTF